MRTLRQRTNDILGEAPSSPTGKAVSAFLHGLIALNVLALVVGTVEDVRDLSPQTFWAIEVFSVAVFTVEYVLRVWACTAESKFSRPISGRLRFMAHPYMLVDLLVILPFYVALMIPSSLDLRVMRVIRLVARLARMERSSHGLRTMGRVVKAKSNELISVITVLLVLLLVASSLVFVFENGVQPDNYSSTPETMWWGIITLTTVGYGDVYPVTVAGRLLTGVIAILGIGLFALPAGILGSGFMKEMESRSQPNVCPHCGGRLPTGK